MEGKSGRSRKADERDAPPLQDRADDHRNDGEPKAKDDPPDGREVDAVATKHRVHVEIHQRHREDDCGA